jgi:Mrp family chromosome partitioning ATPase
VTAPGSMTGVLRALTRTPRQGRGRVVMAISAQRGEGVSTVARGIAEGANAGITLLMDLDLARDGQFRFYQEESFARGARLSDAIDGRLKGQSLYRIIGVDGRLRPEPRSAMAFYRLGRSKLFVAGFDPAAIAPEERLQIPTGPAYWQAVRQSCELAVVDAPALERSRVGLSVCQHMDAAVIVASGKDGSATATLGLKTELEAAGALVLGVVYTRADSVALSLERPSIG